MFQPGQLLVYGSTGVCRVEEITAPNLTKADRGRQYYLLKPLFQDGVIYAPVDNEKISIRPVISREEAEALISLIPSIQKDPCRASSLQALAHHYQAVIHSHDCKDLLKLTVSIYAKRQQAEAQKRRLGAMDERYLKQAERLLHGELSAALGIPYEEVPAYIAKKTAAQS